MQLLGAKRAQGCQTALVLPAFSAACCCRAAAWRGASGQGLALVQHLSWQQQRRSQLLGVSRAYSGLSLRMCWYLVLCAGVRFEGLLAGVMCHQLSLVDYSVPVMLVTHELFVACGSVRTVEGCCTEFCTGVCSLVVDAQPRFGWCLGWLSNQAALLQRCHERFLVLMWPWDWVAVSTQRLWQLAAGCFVFLSVSRLAGGVGAAEFGQHQAAARTWQHLPSDGSFCMHGMRICHAS